ncbi:MAG: restriction endonuclease [Nitrosarchaeum sp.]|nr:restriction endonuclease [Nitrosarchaeum sp.]
MPVRIKKYSGEFEEFSEEKLECSLVRAGAQEGDAKAIVQKVARRISEGMETRVIYRMAMRELRRASFAAAARYDLKFGLMRLGPAGYAFEKYVAHVLKHHGYEVKLNQVIRGRCVEHEVDVAASKGDERILVECKHHEKPWVQCRIQTVLYVKARLDDLSQVFTKAMLVTNTKFSQQAIEYGSCAGVDLLGWRYPDQGSLEWLIDTKKLWPVSILTMADPRIIGLCIEAGLLLLRDVQALSVEELRVRLHLSRQKALRMKREVEEILGGEAS